MANTTGVSKAEVGQQGVHARKRAQERARNGRITAEDWAPEVWRFTELGWSQQNIADALKLSTERIRQIKKETSGDAQTRVIVKPSALPVDRLADDVKPLVEFTAEAFRAFYERYSGYVLPAHAQGWVQDFIDNQNLMLHVPPGHVKSSIFSTWLPVWLIARNRNEQIIVLSKTASVVQTHVRLAGHILATNQRLIKDFGAFKPEVAGDTIWRPASAQFIVTGRDPQLNNEMYTLQALGSGQQILGNRATVAIIDDITDDEIAQSEELTQGQFDYLQKQVFTRLMPEVEGGPSGRICFIAQRVDFNDVYSVVAAMGENPDEDEGVPLFKVIQSPAVLRWEDEDHRDPEPQVLWPEKFSYKTLMRMRARIGSANFETMYQQNPSPAGDRVFKPQWFAGCHDYNRPGYAGVRDDADKMFPVSRVFSIDPSPDSWNGLVVADVLYDREKFVAVILEMKSFLAPGPELEREIERVIGQYQPDYFVFEESATSKYQVQTPFMEVVRRQVQYIRHTTSKNKHDPLRGVQGLASDFEFKRISLPYADESGRDMTQILERECATWPGRGRADVLMALWFIRWNWQQFVPRRNLSGTFEGTTGRTWSFVSQEQRAKAAYTGR